MRRNGRPMRNRHDYDKSAHAKLDLPSAQKQGGTDMGGSREGEGGEELSAWWRQFEGYLEDAGYDVEEWESIESGRSRDFLTMLGCPC